MIKGSPFNLGNPIWGKYGIFIKLKLNYVIKTMMIKLNKLK